MTAFDSRFENLCDGSYKFPKYTYFLLVFFFTPTQDSPKEERVKIS